MLLDQTDSGETRLDDSKKESSPSALNVLKAAAMLTASSPSKNLKHGNSPGSYWLPAFFYPQGFLTAVLQVHARKYRLPLSNLKFRHLVNSHQIEAEGDSIEKVSIPPEDGVLIHGLYLQGAAWDKDRTALCEQCHSQQELFPQIHFLPEVIQPPLVSESSKAYYECPTYQSSVRGQENFITVVHLSSLQDDQLWVLRGVALLCQTDCD